MRFDKIIGSIDENDEEAKTAVKACQDKLSTAFAELALNYSSTGGATKIGGDPFIFMLIHPMKHICDLSSFHLNRVKAKDKAITERKEAGESLPEDEKDGEAGRAFRKAMGGRVLTTAATNGTTIYYAPEFINKLSRTGVRIVLQHEALHCSMAHPSRRAGRLPRLWNIAVDIKVNYLILADLAARKIPNHEAIFKDNLGDYILMEEYAAFLRNPYAPPEKMKHFDPSHALKKRIDPDYSDPNEANAKPLYFADPGLEGDWRRPEFIYDYLFNCIPRCPVCNSPKYEKPDAYKELEKRAKELDEIDKMACDGKCDGKHDHSEPPPPHEHTDACKDKCTEPQTCDCPKDGCGDGDPFGIGDLVDDHCDYDISEEEMKKKLHDAIEQAKRCGAGKLAGGIEEELDQLISPKISFKDFVRSKLHKIRAGSGRCNWSQPKMKPLFANVWYPTRRNPYVNFVCLLDTSGSMSKEDMTLGVSQLQGLDTKGEGYLACFDTQFYPESVVKLKSAKAEELHKAKVVGRGGSMITDALLHYEDYCGKAALLIIITDTGLCETMQQINDALPKQGTEVVWLTTTPNAEFKPNGRIFTLRD